jgi:parallel beta-helix repeat protein
MINDTEMSDNNIGMSIEFASNNTIYANTITNNSNFGIQIIDSISNTIYNNYFNNTVNAYDNSSLGNNWNISKTAGSSIIGGSFLGGNFWQDYAGEDNDGDTIGDTFIPYNASNNISVSGDWLPLKISQYGDGGTSGGGGAGCTSIWSCGEYGDCINDYMERICRDIKNCLTPTNIPAGCVITAQARCVQKQFCGEEEEEEIEEPEEICNPDWTCEGYGECQNDEFRYPLNCKDANDCGTNKGKPEPIPCECTPVLECGDWKECRVDYNMDNLVAGQYVEIEGIQKRDCRDTSGCIDYPVEEEQVCIVNVPVEIKETTTCDETIIEVYNKETQELVSRIRETNNLSGVDVNFIETSQEAYCNYCFNGIQDYDETDIDCGGPSCPECTTEYLDSFVLVKSFVLAAGSMATFFIVYNLVRSLAVSAVEQAAASAAV